MLRGNIFLSLVLRLLVVLVLFTFCRILFYWYNQDLFPGMDWSRFFRILLGGLRFDVSGILYLNALIFILMILPIRQKFSGWYQQTIHVLFVLFNSLGLLANLADMVYYRTTLRRTTLSVLDQFENETNLLGLTWKFISDFWVVTFIFIVLVWLLYTVSKHIRIEGPKVQHDFTFYAGGLIPALVFSGLFIGGVRGDFRKSTRPITISNAAAYSAIPEDVYLIVNTPFTLIRTATTGVIKKVAYYSDEGELAKVFTPEHHPLPDSAFRPLNVVVIILESFSMEFSGFYNKRILGPEYRGYTPFLDSLAARGVTFQYSFANGRKSIDAMPTVLSSIPSIEVPFVLSHYSNNKVNSLASLLKPKGYHSSFFHGAPNGSMGFDAFSRQAGFDSYYGKNEFGSEGATDGIWGIWDHDFFPFFGNKLSELPQPFCAALFSLSSHHPFELPPSHKGRYPEGVNKMYPMVRYTDDALKDLFKSISSKPWFANTLFVITADHVSSEVTQPEYKTAWGQYAVPVIFYQQGLEPRFVTDRVAQQMDILPSVLSYLNYESPFVAFGKDLFSPGRNEAFNYAGLAYQLMEDSLILRHDGKKPLALFDYWNDPELKRNLLGKKSIDHLENKLRAYIQQYNNRMVDNRLIVPVKN